MPIKISEALKKKLPAAEQANIEKALLDKSSGVCFLCGAPLHEATQVIVPDHDTPEAEGGATVLNNLNLVHQQPCNAFKKNHPSIAVRPYLRFLEAVRKAGGFVKYGQAIQLLGIEPEGLDLVAKGNEVEISIAGQPKRVVPVYSETNKEGTFRFCYVDLPKKNIFNDDKCQPRTIKPQHIWSIYSDINRNPLHEAPACRIEKVEGTINAHRALLFDGQHKALSFWIAGRDSVVTKIYLNLTKDQAIRLVNSVQAKIKKLPLSPFELAAKMSEEWQERVAKYETEVGTEAATEQGFVSWVDSDERTRAKQAFVDALYETVLEGDVLTMKSIVVRPGQSAGKTGLTEASFRGKLLKPLLHTLPLSEPFPESQKLRQRERETVVKLLNLFHAKAFKQEGTESPQEAERSKRLMYQSSLSYVATLLRRLAGHVLATSEPRQLLEKTPDDAAWAKIEAGVDRLLAHPVWTADYNKSAKMKAVKDALQKNQNADKAFGAVGLKLGYLIGADELEPHELE